MEHCPIHRSCRFVFSDWEIRLPISQLSPLKPETQSQKYVFTPSMQAPSFWHGLDEHSSISKENMNSLIVKSAVQHDVNVIKL